MHAKGVCAVAAFVLVGVLVAFSCICIVLKRRRRRRRTAAARPTSEASDSSLRCDSYNREKKSTFSYTPMTPSLTALSDTAKSGSTCTNFEDEICPICLGKYVDGDVLEELSCSHAYHEECIERLLLCRWLACGRLRQCPMCRAFVE